MGGAGVIWGHQLTWCFLAPGSFHAPVITEHFREILFLWVASITHFLKLYSFLNEFLFLKLYSFIKSDSNKPITCISYVNNLTLLHVYLIKIT